MNNMENITCIVSNNSGEMSIISPNSKFVKVNDQNVSNDQLVDIINNTHMHLMKAYHYRVIDYLPIGNINDIRLSRGDKLLKYIAYTRSIDMTGKLYCDILVSFSLHGNCDKMWKFICNILCRLFTIHLQSNSQVSIICIQKWYKIVFYKYFSLYKYVPWQMSSVPIKIMCRKILKLCNVSDDIRLVPAKLFLVTGEPESIYKLKRLTHLELKNALYDHLFNKDKPLTSVLPDYPGNGIGFDESLVVTVIEQLLIVNKMTHKPASSKLLFIMKLIRLLQKNDIKNKNVKISTDCAGNFKEWYGKSMSDANEQVSKSKLKGWYWQYQLHAAKKKYSKIFF